MLKLVKCQDRDEIFELENGVKRWIGDWNTFVYLGYKIEDVKIIPFQELKSYPVCPTKVKKTITTIIEGNDPDEIFYPDSSHKTDRLYKMLYVCPDAGDTGWLDEVQEVGFNVVHTYTTDKYPWEKALDDWLDELTRRDMYGCFQLPHGHIENFIKGMAQHDNAILSSVEEPDAKAGRTSKNEQMRIYELANKVGLPVWGCLDWGLWKERVNFQAFDLIMTDSYMYSKWDGSLPLPGTPAEGGYKDREWWSISHKVYNKIKLIKELVPVNTPVINIQQGFYNGENVYPNIEEEWNIYNKELGLNSFAVYPHGQGQGFPSVMDEERIRKQCKDLMIKLDKGVV